MDSLKKFREYWNLHQNGFLDLLSIPSVYDGKTADISHPYGASVYDALCFMEEKCREAGMKVTIYEGQVMAAAAGSGERIDLVSHLDVVEPGEGWKTDPFMPVVKDGAITARGSQDMKSGAWLTYLAVRMLIEEGYPLHKEIRLVFGTDEERTMDDMRTYVRYEGLPAFAFTPDGRFPLVTGEKGALMWILRKPYHGSIISLKAGVQPNVVPPQAEALISKTDKKKAEEQIRTGGIDGTVEVNGDAVHIKVNGRAAHASRPEDGHSAGKDLFTVLSAITDEDDIRSLCELASDDYGKLSGISCSTVTMGPLTLNAGLITIKNGMIEVMADCRYPYGISHEELNAKFSAHYSSFECTLPYVDPPTLVSENDPYITALKEGYREVLGKDPACSISGGVSYSKVFGHCVNFGPVAETSEYAAHQRNEKIDVEDCIQALAVYYYAVKKLLEV